MLCESPLKKNVIQTFDKIIFSPYKSDTSLWKSKAQGFLTNPHWGMGEGWY